MILIKICSIWLACLFVVQAKEKNYTLEEFCFYVDDAGIYDYSKELKVWKLRHILKGSPVESIKRTYAKQTVPKRGGKLDTIIYFSVNRNGKGFIARHWQTRLFFHRYATTDNIRIQMKKLPSWFKQKLKLIEDYESINIYLRKGGLGRK